MTNKTYSGVMICSANDDGEYMGPPAIIYIKDDKLRFSDEGTRGMMHTYVGNVEDTHSAQDALMMFRMSCKNGYTYLKDVDVDSHGNIVEEEDA